MKRFGGLWPQVVGFDALWRASRKARRGKRLRPDVAEFEYHLERNLWRLHDELLGHSYQPGAFHTFRIFDPKERWISAAPYRDRVVHHALTAVLEQVFEPSFIHDSYACRRGRGVHAAARRAEHFARRSSWVLKLDIRQYFPSVDHQILASLLERRVRDPDVLWLVHTVLRNHDHPEQAPVWFPGDSLLTPLERTRGLPIGNQTSQFFSNVYLNPLDHFVLQELKPVGYVRYADDLLVFGRSRDGVRELREGVIEYLKRLRLRPHPRKSEYFPVKQGIPFVGFRIHPGRIRLARGGVRRFRRRARRMQRLFAEGSISFEQIRQRLVSWTGHAAFGASHQWCEALLASVVFRRGDSR